MKKIIGIFITLVLFCNISCAKGRTDNYQSEISQVPENTEEFYAEPEELKPLFTLQKPSGLPVTLKESWGYVSQTHLDEYDSKMPLTDVCLFAGEINTYGELAGVPKRSKIDVGNARCHLVIICESRSLSHFILDPQYDLRKKLIKDIVKAAEPYDGVQIDFESIPGRDRKHFLTFLADLRYSLGSKKWFSVCVPARTKYISDDIFPYEEISKYCDRVFVMAYDESWSGSKPGPIASISWCKRVLDYAKKTIPEKKLIMGIPFYGRTWGSEKNDSAWYFSSINRIMTEHKVEEVIYENDIPSFKYTAQIDVTGFFNDAYSDVNLCRLYESSGIQKIGFWRVGQEDPEIWNWINIEKK